MNRCVLCGVELTTDINLVSHVSQEPPLACPTCLREVPRILAYLRDQATDLRMRLNAESQESPS